ncbi:hypothetical protein CANARDRAFT_188992, partial [[Candida] arabinofermentans NRRL YB-2248]
MKFVALVSGGKDSCFNILHCQANGHELICLANLYPPPSDSDELDSFMYQTVGHDILAYYEQCIGKPMYRQMITGGSENQNLEYKKTLRDETEDLYELLKTVKKHHPDVEGVSVGAILSSYQRTRVEDVCARLELTALSYLWQRDQTELMGEMCSSGMEAILIKVAAIGLNDKNLGMTLQQAYPILLKLNDRFGVHVCGEGGEFETLVLDAPFFSKARLVITEREVVKHTNDDVWYLKLKVDIQNKTQEESNQFAAAKHVVEPPLLNNKFSEISELFPETLTERNDLVLGDDFQPIPSPLWKLNVKKIGNKYFIGNITSTKVTVQEQVEDIFNQLKGTLEGYKLEFSNVQSASLLIKSMSDFATINGVYKTFFSEPLPPARICVETNMPLSILAQLSVVVIDDIAFKSGLHVQGRSYWAPSNIGPYSQTVIDRRDQVAHLSGQIPLIPKNMITCNDLKLATLMSLQHLDNVKQVTSIDKQLYICCFITNVSWLETVVKAWEEYTSEDLQYQKNLVIVKVKGLPRGCKVEWGGLSYKDVI